MDGIQYTFSITYSSSITGYIGTTNATSNSTVISNLIPGSEYVFSVTTVQAQGSGSTPASISVYTNPSPPGDIRIDSVETDSVSLSWGRPPGMDGIQYTFSITYSSSITGYIGTTNATSNSTVISNLIPGSKYVFNVTTVQAQGSGSTPASISVYTKAEIHAILAVKYKCSDEPQQCQKIVEEKFRAILGKQLSGVTWSLKILDNQKGN
ncbi:receptor-type tyrosine-protein phosphatase eta-like [Polyodon spathula]|uniref:receptor-type tyrosine-protein phosphatase eta-like n=1 Tax=Polyodon spathula TaxID=7913 RepID=UPI001B7EEB6F|nr:receptor-type tyrosine-protein phosphatase eta-like [Polyodon spathula]